MTETLGYIAALLTTLAFVPQVIQCWRTRDTRSISTGMYISFCTGVALWLLYGVRIESTPVIVANAVTLVLASSILALKLHNRDTHPKDKAPDNGKT